MAKIGGMAQRRIFNTMTINKNQVIQTGIISALLVSLLINAYSIIMIRRIKVTLQIRQEAIQQLCDELNDISEDLYKSTDSTTLAPEYSHNLYIPHKNYDNDINDIKSNQWNIKQKQNELERENLSNSINNSQLQYQMQQNKNQYEQDKKDAKWQEDREELQNIREQNEPYWAK
jgi:hypothetical protein